MTSLIAAVALTSFKIVVGFFTGSLGILAEAAHSGLDLVAAIVTYVAVRVSSRPPDADHHYGHGKVENLSALFETGLLLITCGWIVWEAVARLISGTAEIRVTFWSFAVMGTSIVIDWSRSRALYRTAKRYNSQALEADALHFQTDIWSSCVVILGLACVKAGEWFLSLTWLRQADTIAALGVALIVVGVSGRLGFRAIQELLDAAPVGMEKAIIRAVENVQGVTNCHNVRLRHSGPKLIVDLHILADGSQSLHEAHRLTEEVENAIRSVVPEADVTVHPEPAAADQTAPRPGG